MYGGGSQGDPYGQRQQQTGYYGQPQGGANTYAQQQGASYGGQLQHAQLQQGGYAQQQQQQQPETYAQPLAQQQGYGGYTQGGNGTTGQAYTNAMPPSQGYAQQGTGQSQQEWGYNQQQGYGQQGGICQQPAATAQPYQGYDTKAVGGYAPPPANRGAGTATMQNGSLSNAPMPAPYGGGGQGVGSGGGYGVNTAPMPASGFQGYPSVNNQYSPYGQASPQGAVSSMQGSEQPSPPKAVPDYVHVCDPQQLSLTTEMLPSATSTAQRAHVPLGVILQPLAESEVECPLVNFGAVGVVRCKHCRAYINPYVTWTDGGAHWRCNLCNLMNETPSGYYSSLDHTGRRADLDKRPELVHSTVEIVATPHYMIRAPMPCVFFFVLDVSKAAVSSGMLARTCNAILNTLEDLPGGKRTMIGFITFDSTVHFYSFLGSQARMHVSADLEDVFLPEPRGLLVNLLENKEKVQSLLENLPLMHGKTDDVEAALGPALKAALDVMKPVGGKLSMFSATLPSIGVGRLMNRANPNKLGKPDEHKLLLPASDYFKEEAFKFSHNQISCDVYLFSRHYTDVTTLNELARFTGGSTHRFPAYYDPKDGADLHRLIVHSLTRTQGWEAVVRVRVGKGYRVTDFFGNFRLRSTDLITVPCIDSDKAFALKLDVSEKGVDTPVVSVQSALLYTTSFGERRIRVQTLCVPVTSFTTHVYQGINSSAVTSLLFKHAITMVTTTSFEKAREFVRKTVTALLRSYSYTSNSYTGQQLQLPANLQELPLQCLGILKHEALRDRNIPSDQRAAIHALLQPMGLAGIEISVRPRLMPIHQLDGKQLPEELELSAAAVDSNSALLLDDGRHFSIRVGANVDSKWVHAVFDGANTKAITLKELPEDEKQPIPLELERVHQVLDSLRTPFHKGVSAVQEGDPDEAHFYAALIQDRSMGEQSLAEYMQFILRR